MHTLNTFYLPNIVSVLSNHIYVNVSSRKIFLARKPTICCPDDGFIKAEDTFAFN